MSKKDKACIHCGTMFSEKKNLYAHHRRFHPNIDLDIPSNQICSLCDFRCRTMVDIHNHFRICHSEISLVFENHLFYCKDDFMDWKLSVEEETCSYFVKRSSNKYLANGKISTYYSCHRSGNAIVKENRIRGPRLRGSNKINRTCPAVIRTLEQAKDEPTAIEVEYQSIHVGHDKEVKRKPLTTEIRRNLAEEMARGISKTAILNNLQISSSKRARLIRRKDLHNICRDFKISKEVLQQDPPPAKHRKVKIVKQEQPECVGAGTLVEESLVVDEFVDHPEYEEFTNQSHEKNLSNSTTVSEILTNDLSQSVKQDIKPRIENKLSKFSSFFVNDKNNEQFQKLKNKKIDWKRVTNSKPNPIVKKSGSNFSAIVIKLEKKE